MTDTNITPPIKPWNAAPNIGTARINCVPMKEIPDYLLF